MDLFYSESYLSGNFPQIQRVKKRQYTHASITTNLPMYLEPPCWYVDIVICFNENADEVLWRQDKG